MQESIAPVSAAAAAPTVVAQPDMRPTADAAILARDTTPDIPLPVPASLAPLASVNQSRLSGNAQPADPVAQVERTLKPYGVTMLPQGPAAPVAETPPQQNDTADDDTSF